jgi:hypothetical protein
VSKTSPYRYIEDKNGDRKDLCLTMKILDDHLVQSVPDETPRGVSENARLL